MLSTYNAHTSPHKIKLFSNAYDDKTRQSGVFYEMQKSIQSAENFICVSIWCVSLIQNMGLGQSLGQLLVSAERRGVKVFILAWDSKLRAFINERTNENIKFLKEQNPRNFFYKKCTQGNDFFEKKFHSHHQKFIFTEKKGFICGMNFTSKSVDSIEHDDMGGTMWHDAAAMVEGSLLHDLMYEFFQAWNAQPSNNMLYNSNENAVEQLTQSVGRYRIVEVSSEVKEQDGFIQLLVSNNRALKYSTAEKLTLFSSGADSMPANEIHQAMIEVITQAKNYIFIATQYFIGYYEGHEDSSNRISLALIDRIQKAHVSSEDFHVYFTITALPGGGDSGVVVDSVTRQQWKTMRYLINQLNEKTDNQAEKYITFMELGRYNGPSNKYFQIYVHSKFIFTKDEIVIGSANLNERSLTKNRDSECCIRIQGYRNVIDEFMHNIILEYFGSQVYGYLMKKNLMSNIGSQASRDAISAYLEMQLSPVMHNYHFEHNNYKRNLQHPTVDVYHQIMGCAMPWGLIKRENILRAEKPPRVPDSSSGMLSVLNGLGGQRYTR